MDNEILLNKAKSAEQLAELFQELQATLDSVNIVVESQMAEFWRYHNGAVPTELWANYQTWKDNVTKSLPYLDSVINKCQKQAWYWRSQYEKQKLSGG